MNAKVLKGNWVYPLLIGLLASYWLYAPRWYLLLLGCWLLLKLGCMKNGRVIAASFLCGLFLLGNLHVFLKDSRLLPVGEAGLQVHLLPDSIQIDGDQLSFEGTLQQKRVKVYYTLKSLEEQKQWQQTTKSALLLVQGTWQAPQKQRNLQGYDQEASYFGKRVVRSCYADKLLKNSTSSWSFSALRRSLLLKLQKSLKKTVKTYVQALILGFRDDDFNERAEMYKKTGLLHLFSLSGLHIQLFLGSILQGMKRFGAPTPLRIGGLCLLGAATFLLTGESISVLRAVSFFLLRFLTEQLRLPLSRWDQVAWSVFLCHIWYPLALLTSGGRLSIGLSLLLTELGMLDMRQLRQAVWLNVLSIPLLAAEFGEWPILGGALTLLVMPLFNWLILPLCGLLFLAVLLGPLPVWLTEGSEIFFQGLETCLSKAAFTPLVLGKPGSGTLLVLCGLIFLLTVAQSRWKRSKRTILLLLFFLLLASGKYSAAGIIAFIDVGQGDSIFIKTPFAQETFLIDTGGRLLLETKEWQKRREKHQSDYNLLPFLKAQGVMQLTHVIVTHSDADHMGELLHLLETVAVKNLYIGKGGRTDPKLAAIIAKAKETGTAVREVAVGDVIGTSLLFYVLHPLHSTGSNNDSIVLWTKIAQTRFLLTGDLEKEGEQALLARFPAVRADVLKVGHHGSDTSSTAAFLAAIQAETAIISVGQNNRYNHPRPEVLERLETAELRVLRTDEGGMVYYNWLPERPLSAAKQVVAFPADK